jgi:hypothetical protein
MAIQSCPTQELRLSVISFGIGGARTADERPIVVDGGKFSAMDRSAAAPQVSRTDAHLSSFARDARRPGIFFLNFLLQ